MNSYFDHEYVSASNLKEITHRYVHGETPMEGLDEIFDLGSLIHAVLLEPFRVDFTLMTLRDGNRIIQYTEEKFKMAVAMSRTFMKDELCRKFLFMQDFKREHEFYSSNVHGLKARCKMDGYSRFISSILEYKGLGITTDKQLDEAIYRFDYDLSAAWYLDVTRVKNLLIVAPSKKATNLLFKRLVDRDHAIYKSGSVKVAKAVYHWKMFFN